MTNREWQADIYINETLAKTCIENQFPSLQPIQIQYIGEGWDNKIFLVNDNLIFRFPRRKEAVKSIERENMILKYLQSHITLQIPNPQYIGHSTDKHPYPFQGYKKIAGYSGSHAQLSAQERKKSIIALSHFLKELHSIKKDQAIEIGIKPQKANRADIKDMIVRLKKRVEFITTNNITQLNQSVFDQEMQSVSKLDLPIDDIGLVHGDLYCNHILFNKGVLIGVIDWGDAGINHQAVDLGIIHSFYPKNHHDIFFEHYGRVNLVSWQHARFVGLYIALTVIPYAHEMRDQQLKNESIAAVKRISPSLLF